MALGALIGICARHFDHVIVVMIAVWMQQVAITQVVGMPLMFDRGVAAGWPVVVFVIMMSIAFVHDMNLTSTKLLCNPAHPERNYK